MFSSGEGFSSVSPVSQTRTPPIEQAPETSITIEEIRRDYQRSQAELRVLLQRTFLRNQIYMANLNGTRSGNVGFRLNRINNFLAENYELLQAISSHAQEPQPVSVNSSADSIDRKIMNFLVPDGNTLRYGENLDSRYLVILRRAVQHELRGWSRVNDYQINVAVHNVLQRALEQRDSAMTVALQGIYAANRAGTWREDLRQRLERMREQPRAHYFRAPGR